MKTNICRTYILLMLFLMSVILSACGSNGDPQASGSITQEITSEKTTEATDSSEAAATEQTEETSASTSAEMPLLSVLDYFPLTPDVFFDYAGTGNEFVPMTVYVEFVGTDKIQMVYDNGGTQTHTLYSAANGQVQVINTVSELYVREDLSRLDPQKDGEILLMEPIEIGTSWDAAGDTRTITGVDEPVTTPAGSFLALVVTTAGDTTTTRQYYAAGIGLVKMTVEGEYEITQELKTLTTNAPSVMNLTVYYPRMTDTDIEIVYKEIPVYMKTNDTFSDILTTYFRTPVESGLQPIMSQNGLINEISLDQGTGIVTIDLSANYVPSMNVGSSMEGAVLQCLTNTVGHAYGVEEVIVTLDGQPYESGHIALAPGDTFKVDYQDAAELS